MTIAVAVPTVEETVVRMREEILADVARGKHGAALCFMDLSIDAPDLMRYGGFDDAGHVETLAAYFAGPAPDDTRWPDDLVEYMLDCRRQVDVWIRRGGLALAQQLLESLRRAGGEPS